jgi:hypothetical protein
MCKSQGRSAACILLLVLGGALLSMPRLSEVWAQTPQPQKKHEHSPQGPVHITMEELHRLGGVPPGGSIVS